MLIFKIKPNGLGVRLKEFVDWVDDQVEIELLNHISFFLQYLGGWVLICTTRDKLFERRNLVSLLEFGSNEQGSNPNELQFWSGHSFDPEVLIDEWYNGEDGFREHLEFLMQFRQPVDELPSLLLTNIFLCLQIVAHLEGQFLLMLQKAEILHEVFRHHLWILDLKLRHNLLLNNKTTISWWSIGMFSDINRMITMFVVDKLWVTLVVTMCGCEYISDLFPEDSVIHVSVK